VTPRLKAEFWVKAHIRRCWVEDTIAVVVRRGDESAGTVLLKLNDLADGCAVLLQGAREGQLDPFLTRLRGRIQEEAGDGVDPRVSIDVLSHPADSGRIRELLGISRDTED